MCDLGRYICIAHVEDQDSLSTKRGSLNREYGFLYLRIKVLTQPSIRTLRGNPKSIITLKNVLIPYEHYLANVYISLLTFKYLNLLKVFLLVTWLSVNPSWWSMCLLCLCIIALRNYFHTISFTR